MNIGSAAAAASRGGPFFPHRKGEDGMTEKLTMTVLSDNIAEEPLISEWGLSILLEADGRRILLDTGAGEAFVSNARALDIDLSMVDAGVLSHAHYDHADGLEAFFECNAKAPFYIREGAEENCFGRKEGGMTYIGIRRGTLERWSSRIRAVSGVYEIAPGILLVPHLLSDCSDAARRGGLYVERNGEFVPDDFSHEQSLVIDTPRGAVIFSSCSHTGPLNILRDVRELAGRTDILAYVGGLHLYTLTDGELYALRRQMKEMSVGRIFTGHCTGDRAFEVLKEELGDGICQFRAGFRHAF